MSLFRNLLGKQDPADKLQRKVAKRIAALSLLGTVKDGHRGKWHDIYASQQGVIVEADDELPAGKWLCFLWHYELAPRPDNRMIIEDAACFWINNPVPVRLRGGGTNYPIPEEIKELFIEDGNYTEWKVAFQAIEKYFPQSNWKYQWSWRTDRVKRFMEGGCPNWTTMS